METVADESTDFVAIEIGRLRPAFLPGVAINIARAIASECLSRTRANGC